jgi:hypothetical protein
MIGRSMSPSMNCTATSEPMRGTQTAPQLAPAAGVATRTQVPLCSLPGALPVSSAL